MTFKYVLSKFPYLSFAALPPCNDLSSRFTATKQLISVPGDHVHVETWSVFLRITAFKLIKCIFAPDSQGNDDWNALSFYFCLT